MEGSAMEEGQGAGIWAVGTAVQRPWGKGGLGLFEKQKGKVSPSGRNSASKNIPPLGGAMRIE